MTTLYGIPNCDTVKKARTWLDKRGLAATFHDYKKEGADPERIARPLLTAALDNSLREGDRALTGPVARGDHATVRAHIDEMPDADVEHTYRALALATVDRARAAGTLSEADAAELRGILSGEDR